MGADQNGDQEDIKEEGSWLCPNLCGAGGPCVKGDEAMLEAIHLGSCPNA